MSWEAFAAAALVILVAYFIRGISGFGSGLVAVPLLALLLPLRFVVPLILVLDFSAALTISRHARQHVRWSELKPLLPFAILGVLLGVTLLIHMPARPALTALAAFVIIFGLRNVLNIHGSRLISRWWAAPAGMAGGIVGALFGTGGPAYVIYLSHRLRDKAEMRATFSGLFMLDGGFRIATFIVTGLLLQKGMLAAILGSIPPMALGLYLGHRAHVGISQRHMLRLIGTLLLLSGTSLLWKAWH